MKRFIFIFLAVLVLFPGVVLAADIGIQNTITTAVAASDDYSGTDDASGSYDLKGADGYVAVQVSVAGSGTLSMTYLMSNDRETFVEPEAQQAADDILSGITSASGTVFTTFTPVMGRYMKFSIAETGTASAYTATIIPSIK